MTDRTKKHTKGPWKKLHYDLTDNHDHVIQIQTPIFALDLLAPIGMSGEEFKANAKLIAAAPELLEEHITDVVLLNQAIDYLRNHTCGIEHAISHIRTILIDKERVIKKATE